MGLGVNLLNPKVVIFYMTFLPQFVTASDPNAWKIMLFLGLYLLRLHLPAHGRDNLRRRQGGSDAEGPKPGISRAIDYVFGTVFAAFAIKILTTEGR